MKSFKEFILTEAKKPKAFFGKGGDFTYAVSIDGIDNTFPTQPFGRVMKDIKAAEEFKKDAKSDFVGSKGKATLPAVRAWVKENSPTEFYAKWKSDSSHYKDDSIQIWYK